MLLFVSICGVCVAGIVLIVIWGRMQGSSLKNESVSMASTLHQELPVERLYFRSTALGLDFGRLAYLEKDSLEPQYHASLSCEAVHVSGGRGLCLSADRGVLTTYTAYVFDANSDAVLGEFTLGGAPSRTRVSSDGNIAVSTVFVTGHGYDSVDFSTQTMLYDLVAMAPIADLESFTVVLDGETISQPDFNFWGVTFVAGEDRFFATLSTGGEHYLVKGDVASQTVSVVRNRVECPSVSPDGSKVAYKRRRISEEGIGWDIHVLLVSDGRDIRLVDERSIDDQLEWLDNERVLYSVPDTSSPAVTNVWVSNADGSGIATVFLENAYSPAVVR